tara:strand:- start:2859 stop:3140 length:282 start_codon:yes stop_codon:yes gene_type:complete
MTNNTFKLSDQALGAIMMALQHSLMNQTDIVPVLKDFDLVNTADGLIVQAPPSVVFNDPDCEVPGLIGDGTEERKSGGEVFANYLKELEKSGV